jgi:hypothetical protein
VECDEPGSHGDAHSDRDGSKSPPTPTALARLNARWHSLVAHKRQPKGGRFIRFGPLPLRNVSRGDEHHRRHVRMGFLLLVRRKAVLHPAVPECL